MFASDKKSKGTREGDSALDPDEASQANLWRQGGREVEEDKDLTEKVKSDESDLNVAISDNPLSVLTSILQATLFSDLFCRLSVNRFPGRNLPDVVEKMAGRYPHYYFACRWADFFLRIIIVCFILTVVIGAVAGFVLQTWYPDVLATINGESAP